MGKPNIVLTLDRTVNGQQPNSKARCIVGSRSCTIDKFAAAVVAAVRAAKAAREETP